MQTDPEKMDKAIQHWEILRRVPEELANKVRAFMVIGKNGEGVLLVTEDGDGYWLGEMSFGEKSKQAIEPIRLDVPNLASMAQGLRHILLLNENGQIHAIGENNYGQLGLGTVDRETHFLSQLIPSPHKFTSIRCGYRHNLALTEDGKVWSWGLNNCGQVGVSSSTANPLSSPCQISKLNLHRVVAVECGAFHSLALTSQGEVYGWGSNNFGQVGDGSETSLNTPTRIPTPSSVKSIAAGQCHSLLLTQTGEVYACGWNKFGQLGISTTTGSSSTSLVKVLGLPTISQIASHYDSYLSIAISTDRRCFAWGCLDYFSDNKPFISTPLQFPPIYSTLDSVLSFGSNLRNTPCSVRIEGSECPQGNNPDIQTDFLKGSIRLGDRARLMFNNPDSNPDVKFELGDQFILAHRSVLQISSAHFARLFLESSSTVNPNPQTPIIQPSLNLLRHTTNPSELIPQNTQISPKLQTPFIKIPIPDHAYPAFYAYLRFLYTGTFQVSAEHLTELFELAHSYLESDLEQLCLSRMRSTLSLENCCLFYQLTERHSLPEFQQDVLQFIADNVFQVFSSEAYRSLDGDHCRKLGVSIGSLRR